jgi:hypothetical protein
MAAMSRDRGPLESELKEQINRCVEILRPYSRAVGSFHNVQDVKVALNLAQISLERALQLAARLK